MTERIYIFMFINCLGLFRFPIFLDPVQCVNNRIVNDFQKQPNISAV